MVERLAVEQRAIHCAMSSAGLSIAEPLTIAPQVTGDLATVSLRQAGPVAVGMGGGQMDTCRAFHGLVSLQLVAGSNRHAV